MKTFEQCCDEVANKYKWSDWEAMRTYKDIHTDYLYDSIIKEVAQLHAIEIAKDAIALATEYMRPKFNQQPYTEQEILDKLGL